nr:glycosyltransferase family 2 protein [Actinomyces trachealis]
MVLLVLAYTSVLIVLSRTRRRRLPGPEAADPDLQVIILMPCLNEAKVIRASVNRLLDIPDRGLHVIVIDDGSDDGTTGALAGIRDRRLHVLRRQLPNARKGKGEALNDALDRVRRASARIPDSQVVVGIVDADGHLDPWAVKRVRAVFSDPQVGALQLGVRINNRFSSLLARMQDMEFVIFTSVFQEGRRYLGSVGMGGNAQFTRLSALNALGARPWTRSLTEDFDLGLRLNTTAWRNEYDGTAAVHQQGVTSLKRLVRQRTRWFQGNLQASNLLTRIARTGRGLSRLDSIWQILTPYTLLAGTFLVLSFFLSLIEATAVAWRGEPQSWAWLLGAYLLAAGPALVLGIIYWKVERTQGLSLGRSLWYSHLFVVYGLIPCVIGWRALGRVLLGRTGWAKTAREAEGPRPAPSPPLAVPPGSTEVTLDQKAVA